MGAGMGHTEPGRASASVAAFGTSFERLVPMKITPKTLSSGQAVSRREFVSTAMAAATAVVATTLPAVLPASASAQEARRSNTNNVKSAPSPLVKLDKRTPQLWQVM